MKIELDIPYLNKVDYRLLDLLIAAHAKTAIDNANASSAACVNAGAVTGKLTNGLASAILCLGGHHAPIMEARIVYRQWTKEQIKEALLWNKLIPGFGNAFYKDSIDPAWQGVDDFLYAEYPQEYARIRELRDWMRGQNVNLFPNAALYSAVSCDIMECVWGAEISILILARLPMWTTLWLTNNDSSRLINC
jgi:citrate synthase